MPIAKMSIARRSLLDLPMAASGSGPAMTPSSSGSSSPAPANSSASGALEADAMRPETGASPATDPDFDLSSTFDVPAFLRRQEG